MALLALRSCFRKEKDMGRIFLFNDSHGNPKMVEKVVGLIDDMWPGDIVIANGDIAGSRGPKMNELARIYYNVRRAEKDESVLHEAVRKLTGEQICIPHEWIYDATHFGMFRALLAERNTKFRELIDSEITCAIDETLTPLGAAAKKRGVTIYYLPGNGELVPFDVDTSDIKVERTVDPDDFYYNKLARAGRFASDGIQFVPGAKLLPRYSGNILLLSTYLLDKDRKDIAMALGSVGAFGRERVEISKVVVHYPPMIAPLGKSFPFWKYGEVDERRIGALGNILGRLKLRDGAKIFFGHIHLGATDQKMDFYPQFMGWNKTICLDPSRLSVTAKCIWVKPGEIVQI